MQKDGITDFKFIGKVESQTNDFYKNFSFSSYYIFFSSKTNRFSNFYAKLLRKKTLEPNSWLK